MYGEDPVASAKATPAAPESEPAPFAPPALAQVIKLYDASTGEQLSLDALLDRLAREEVVFFGETHLDETTHRLELAVYEGLIERTDGKVVLAMEMFERDTQPVVDQYLKGEIDEMHFMHRARAWSNYRTGYRALIETAKKHGLPDFGSVGATCNVTVELEGSLLYQDLESFQRHVKNAYVACSQAVNDELARQRQHEGNGGSQKTPQTTTRTPSVESRNHDRVAGNGH